MARRLVLGCGSIGHAVVVALADRPGDLSVIDADPERVETFRNEGISARHGDPTDPDVVSGAAPAETVFVGGDDPASNLRSAEAARAALPDAALVVYVGAESDPGMRAAIDDLADRTVDPGATVLDRLGATIEDDSGRRLHELWRTLRGVSGRLGVFTHDNPDPDAIAAATALCDLARATGTEAEACYFGAISHQENRALVNVLELDLRQFDPGEFDAEEYDAIALVDHSRPGVNDQLPEDLPVSIVIDHHPPRGPVEGSFVDLRSEAGATSTLLAGYYQSAGIDIDDTVATALLYGIRADTRDFGREITTSDFDAAAFLTGHADVDALARIESPSVTGTMLSVLARAIANRQIRGSTLATSAGWTSDRDALAQAADTLLAMDGITTTLVVGIHEETETVIASARARGTDVDVGEVLRLAYDQIGSAGGHTDMAGAQVPLGILGAVQSAEESEEGPIEELVADVLLERFFEVLAEEGAVGAAHPAHRRSGAPTGVLESVDEENDFSPRDPSA